MGPTRYRLTRNRSRPIPFSLLAMILRVNYCGRVIRFRAPPVTATARLLYFARLETFPLDIPSVLPVDWPTAMAQGVHTAQTQADIIEVNSHAGAQFVPPSHGTGRLRSHRSRGSSRRTVFGGLTSSLPAPRGIATGNVPQRAGIHGLSLS